MEAKIDGMAEQLRVEIIKGMETLRLELSKNGQKTNVSGEETGFGKSAKRVINME